MICGLFINYLIQLLTYNKFLNFRVIKKYESYFHFKMKK